MIGTSMNFNVVVQRLINIKKLESSIFGTMLKNIDLKRKEISF